MCGRRGEGAAVGRYACMSMCSDVIMHFVDDCNVNVVFMLFFISIIFSYFLVKWEEKRRIIKFSGGHGRRKRGGRGSPGRPNNL